MLLVIAVAFLTVVGWLASGVLGYRRAAAAAGGFPFQVGLTNTIITPCVLTPVGECVGHPLCASVPGACAAYSGVSGTPAGGMGSEVLLRNDVIAQIGLAPGASYIGGGTSPLFMHASASIGGASYAFFEKINTAIDFIIAGFVDK
jgi:hypothetical protein